MKKISILAAVMFAALFNTVSGAVIAVAVGAPPIFGAIGMNGLGVAQNVISQYGYSQSMPFFFAGLNREIWLAELMQKFRPDAAWLKEARDLSAYVNNDIINLADAGADPGVIINYDGTYDIPVADTEDQDILIQLYNMSTEQDQVKASLQKTRPYDIMQDRVGRHNDTLTATQMKLAAYGIAPVSNSQFTPVLETSGDGDGSFLAITLNDIIDLNTKFSNENMNPTGVKPILILNPVHLNQLAKEDKALFKSYVGITMEDGFDLLGFKAYKSTVTPLYNKSTGVRKAYGSLAAPSTDTIASFAFLPKEAGYAKGTMDAFVKKADPARQSDFVNFAVRFFAGSMRAKGLGAIISKAD
jgi:hypothetical protein